MTPILGILASQISGHLASPSSYESISTVTVGAGGSSTITFSSIPSTYTHLQLRCFHTNSNNNQGANLRINNDSSASYARHYLGGYGTSSAISGGGASLTNISFYFFVGNANSSTPLIEIIDFFDYTNTSKRKTVKALVGTDGNGSGEVSLVSGVYYDYAAISRIDVYQPTGNFNQFSSFALYGIKGA